MAVVSKLKSPRVLIRHYGQILTAFPKVFKTSFNFGNVKALALNYNGAIRIKKINVRSSKVAVSQKLQQFHNQILIWQKYNFKKV